MFAFRNIKYIYLKYSRKIRNFLLSNSSREFLIFLFFFLVASGFWLLQTLNYDYETEFSIPLKLKGVPNDVVLTSELPADARVVVKDKGTVLLNYMLGQSFYPIMLDFNEYSKQGNHVRIPLAVLEKKISAQFAASTKILGIKPDTVDFIFAKGKAKKIPVRLQGNLSAGRQYYIVDTLYSPDSVVVYAPRNILDTLKVARTIPVDLENITDTTRQQVMLAKVKGARFVPNTIQVTLPIDILTEKTIDVPVIGINFPAGKILRTFPSKIKVTFQIGLRLFKTVRSDDFVLGIDYNDLIKADADKYKVTLEAFPPNIKHIQLNPPEVEFLIEQVPGNEAL